MKIRSSFTEYIAETLTCDTALDSPRTTNKSHKSTLSLATTRKEPTHPLPHPVQTNTNVLETIREGSKTTKVTNEDNIFEVPAPSWFDTRQRYSDAGQLSAGVDTKDAHRESLAIVGFILCLSSSLCNLVSY